MDFPENLEDAVVTYRVALDEHIYDILHSPLIGWYVYMPVKHHHFDTQIQKFDTAKEAYAALCDSLPRQFKLEMPDRNNIPFTKEKFLLCRALRYNAFQTRLIVAMVAVIPVGDNWVFCVGNIKNEKIYSVMWDAIEAAVAWVNSAPDDYKFEKLK